MPQIIVDQRGRGMEQTLGFGRLITLRSIRLLSLFSGLPGASHEGRPLHPRWAGCPRADAPSLRIPRTPVEETPPGRAGHATATSTATGALKEHRHAQHPIRKLPSTTRRPPSRTRWPPNSMRRATRRGREAREGSPWALREGARELDQGSRQERRPVTDGDLRPGALRVPGS